MNTLSAEGVQVHGHGRDKGFPLSGFHLGDVAIMEHHPAHQLHIERAHIQDPAASLSHNSESLWDKPIQGLPIFDPLTKQGGVRCQLLIRNPGQPRLQFINAAHNRAIGFQLPIRSGAHKLCDDGIKCVHNFSRSHSGNGTSVSPICRVALW